MLSPAFGLLILESGDSNAAVWRDLDGVGVEILRIDEALFERRLTFRASPTVDEPVGVQDGAEHASREPCAASSLRIGLRDVHLC